MKMKKYHQYYEYYKALLYNGELRLDCPGCGSRSSGYATASTSSLCPACRTRMRYEQSAAKERDGS